MSGKRRVWTPSEAAEQVSLMQWAALAYFVDAQGETRRVSDYLFAIPNGGSRHGKEAANLKAQGVKPGVSDLFLPVPLGVYNGAWVELKAANGKPSALQLEWLERMAEQGYFAALCYGWRPAAETITKYLGGVTTKSGHPLKM